MQDNRLDFYASDLKKFSSSTNTYYYVFLERCEKIRLPETLLKHDRQGYARLCLRKTLIGTQTCPSRIA